MQERWPLALASGASLLRAGARPGVRYTPRRAINRFSPNPQTP